MAAEADGQSQMHEGMRDLLRSSGLAGLTVPAAFGGTDEEVDPVAVCVVREELMGTSSHLDSLFALQGIGSYALAKGGSDELRREWLPRVAELEVLAALALTESHAGSDMKSLTSRLTPAGGDGLVLNGSKSFISNAGAAGFFATLAREGDGYSMVLVPADSPGVTVTPTPELIAPHILGEIEFHDVAVPAANRIGPPEKGFGLVLATLAMFRVSVAGAAVGLAQAALDEATRHARERKQFGAPLAELGAVSQMLADSWTDLEMARMLTYRAAERAQADPRAALADSSMAKLAASEIAGEIVDRAVQIMGRFGLIRDAKIERLYRQARPMRIYEGATEVLRLQISKELLERSK